MKENIFDIKNLDDLPLSVKTRLYHGHFKKETLMLLSLFYLKETLDINELIAGMSRKFKIERERQWFHCAAYNLVKSGFIEKVINEKSTFKRTRK